MAACSEPAHGLWTARDSRLPGTRPSVSLLQCAGRRRGPRYARIVFRHPPSSADGVDPAVGDLCLYAPWGNLCIFYQDSGYSDGLLPLRRIEAGMDLITEMDGPFTATLEAAPSILVAYFSCTGNTETVAGRLSDRLAADLYEIVPEDPYTSADLDYRDPSGRASQEQNDAAARPAISDEVTSMEGYDVVFLGYPIWWGQAPRIISTFLELSLIHI